MSSLSPDCNELKRRYDGCFNRWYADKFLQGNAAPDKECEDIFKLYKACVWRAVEHKRLDTLIGEARTERPLDALRDDDAVRPADDTQNTSRAK